MIRLLIGDGGDITPADFTYLVQVVAEANETMDFEDERLQRIETALDLTLMQIEKETTP